MASYDPTRFASPNYDINNRGSTSPYQSNLTPNATEYTENYQHQSTINMSAVCKDGASYYPGPHGGILSPPFSWQQYDPKLSTYELAWNKPQVSRMTSPLSSLADCSLVEDSASILSPYVPSTFEPIDYATQLSFPNSPQESWVHIDDLGMEHSSYNYPVPYDTGSAAVLLNVAPYPKAQQDSCMKSSLLTPDLPLLSEEETPRKRKKSSPGYSPKPEDSYVALFTEGDEDEGSDYNPQPSKKSKTRSSPKTGRSRNKKNCHHNYSSSNSSRASVATQKTNLGLDIAPKANRYPIPYRQHEGRISNKTTLNRHMATTYTRQFTCIFQIYGCTSHFGSKNEWKRHIATKHLRTAYWRCHLGRCAPVHTDDQPKDFNRKDLFMQHIRRMHTPAHVKDKKEMNASVDEIARSCYHHVRDPPPRSICGYCYAVGKKENFSGANSWELRMEHIGKHLEAPGIEDKNCMHDGVLEAWLIKEGLIVDSGEGGLVLESLIEESKTRSR